MAFPSSTPDGSGPLVADTSALINLNATGHADTILGAFPNRVVVVDTVIAELDLGRRTGRGDADAVAAWVRAGRVEVVALGPSGLDQFERLVFGAAVDTLDDGEAATLAYAAQAGAIAIIDEGKATRIARQKMKSVVLLTTVDLLAHSAVERALGREPLADAVHRALTQARMQVFEHNIAWIIDLIGEDRAAICISLPRSARRSVAGSAKG